MRYVAKFLIALVAAAIFGLLQSVAIDLAFIDAIAERLDGWNGQSTNAVKDYILSTSLNRAVGLTIILAVWTAVVFGIDLVVDAAFPKHRQTNPA